MQVIVHVTVSPDEYEEQAYHKQIERPEKCPCCRARNSMTGHGTYSRFVSGIKKQVLLIPVRRFLCKECLHTTSLLPSFAHPHRFINLITLERFIRGEIAGIDVSRNIELLRRYIGLLRLWAKRVKRSKARSTASTPETPARIYERFMVEECSLPETTAALVNRHHTALFGAYRCLRLPAAA